MNILQRYWCPHIELPALPQTHFNRGILEDILFCQYCMSQECNSEDICSVIMWRHKLLPLHPHHIDLTTCQLFRGPFLNEGTYIIRYIEGMREEEKQRRKEKFWTDLKLARERFFS